MPQDMKNEPTIDSHLLTKETMFGAAVIGSFEPCFRGSSSNAADLDWSLYYGRGIRPFAGVTKLGDYWQRRTLLIGPARSEAESRPFSERRHEIALIPTPLPSAGPAAAQTSEGLTLTCDLHPLVADVAARRFSDGHYSDAVMHAFKAVEYRVQTMVGSPEVGAKLMGIAVGSATPRITVTRATGHTLQSEQEGMRDLFKGTMTALRNPRAHGPHFQDDPEKAQEMLVTASFLMRRLDIEDEKRKNAPAAP